MIASYVSVDFETHIDLHLMLMHIVDGTIIFRYLSQIEKGAMVVFVGQYKTSRLDS